MKTESKKWIPVESPAPVDLWFEEGDRVQFLDPKSADGVLEEWWVVVSASAGQVVVIVGHSTKQIPITRVVAHQKACLMNDHSKSESIKEDFKGVIMNNKKNPTPTDNYARIKSTLDKLVLAKADARVTGLWKSKLVHAEQMCKDVGLNPEAISVSPEKVLEPVAVVVAAPVVITGGTQMLLNRMERVGDELPADLKVTASAPKAQRLVRDMVAKEATKSKSTKPAVVSGDKEPSYCFCGCGGQTSHHREFLQGHDARLGSYIRKLDAGKIVVTELPELVQKMVADNSAVIIKIRSHIVKKQAA
jgi:hypothetical protein